MDRLQVTDPWFEPWTRADVVATGSCLWGPIRRDHAFPLVNRKYPTKISKFGMRHNAG
jgi:hypothetical protein